MDWAAQQWLSRILILNCSKVIMLQTKQSQSKIGSVTNETKMKKWKFVNEHYDLKWGRKYNTTYRSGDTKNACLCL